MPTNYTYIYSRQQRAYIEVIADSPEEAESLAQDIMDSWLPSPREAWDESDDPGS